MGWTDILNDEIIPRLPTKYRDGVRQRLDTLLALEEVPARLVHGDLGGGNVHFGKDGKLTGVVEHLHAVFAGKPLSHIDGFVRSVVAWLEKRG